MHIVLQSTVPPQSSTDERKLIRHVGMCAHKRTDPRMGGSWFRSLKLGKGTVFRSQNNFTTPVTMPNKGKQMTGFYKGDDNRVTSYFVCSFGCFPLPQAEAGTRSRLASCAISTLSPSMTLTTKPCTLSSPGSWTGI